MQELGVGIVNMQAADIDRLTYPQWTGQADWVVGPITGQDEHGYDLYEIDRAGEKMIVPSNRLVMMARLLGVMV